MLERAFRKINAELSILGGSRLCRHVWCEMNEQDGSKGEDANTDVVHKFMHLLKS